jgi:hypothetical protein
MGLRPTQGDEIEAPNPCHRRDVRADIRESGARGFCGEEQEDADADSSLHGNDRWGGRSPLLVG